MLSGIKEMLQQKQSYMEAADIILEDGMGNIDDSIVLGETKGDDIPMPDDEAIETKKEDEENGEPEDKDDGGSDDHPEHEEEDDGKDEPEDDLENEPAEIEPKPEKPEDDPEEDIEDDLASANAEDDGSKPEDEEDDDLMNASAEDESPLPLPGDDSLPAVAGRQTGEPPIDDPQDLLNVEVNMGTGTLKDVLPVPPKNADEAIAGDNPDQHVDSGFGDNGPEVPEPGEPSPQDVPKDDLLSASAEDDSVEEAGKHVSLSGKGKEGLEDMIKNCDNQVSLSDLDDDDDQKGKKSKGKAMTEAITLGDDAGAQQPAADPNAAPAPQPAADPNAAAAPAAAPAADANAAPEAAPEETPLEDAPAEDPAADPTAEEPAEPDNSVTAAVKDKVEEVSEPIENGKEELFKRLSNLSKNLEDAKRILMKTPDV